MRKSALAALIAIVLLPLGLAGWLGLALIANEREAVDYRLTGLVNAQLDALNDRLQQYFVATADRLRQAATAAPNDVDSDAGQMRSLGAAASDVRQVFAMDVNGQRLHPPPDGDLASAERDFLRRTERIWLDKTLLHQSRAEAPEAIPQTTRKRTSPGPAPDDASGTSGWYVWHWEAETMMIFWLRNDDGRLLGFELEPIRVLSDIIGLLPATAPDDSTTADSRIQLIDNRGTLIYQWGGHQPVAAERPAVSLPLAPPLSGWHLAYFAAPLATGRAERGLLVGASLLAATLALVGLGFYVYREHGREARVARQRVSFVNQVSHELKTPLTNIRLYAELLQQHLNDRSEPASRYLDVVVAESQRLSRLIGNVLSLAGLQRKGLSLRRKQAVVDDIISSVAEAFRPAFATHGVTLSFDGAAGDQVSIDPDALEQIINNLLGNVEKYADDGGRVEISSRQDGDCCVIHVRDYGPGIAKPERQKVFEPFYRIDRRLEEGAGGSGIGLSICREIARLHGGDVVLLDCANGALIEVRLRTTEDVV